MSHRELSDSLNRIHVALTQGRWREGMNDLIDLKRWAAYRADTETEGHDLFSTTPSLPHGYPFVYVEDTMAKGTR